MSLEIKGILPKRIINGELERLAERIRAKWVDWYIPRLPEITTAASLAHYGFLRPVKWMGLWDVDLASIPAELMASLAACVTDRVVVYHCEGANSEIRRWAQRINWDVRRRGNVIVIKRR